ncbi:MAG: STAS/SEC14 domain-containing protein [Rubrobacteraceae bacterium]
MLTTKVLPDTNIAEAELDGSVETSEVERLRSELDKLVAEHGEVKLLFVLKDVGNIEPGAIWEDMKLETSLLDDFDRAAIVTDREWFEKAIDGVDPMFEAKFEHFEPGEREAALRWLKS